MTALIRARAASLEVERRSARGVDVRSGQVEGAADARPDQPDLTAGVELVQQPDRPADADPVGLQGPVTLAIEDGVQAEQPAADLRLTQPDRRPLGRARAGPVRPGDVRPGQVKVAPQAQAVAEQAGQARGTGQRQLEQLRALHHRRGVELAPLELQGKGDVQPG